MTIRDKIMDKYWSEFISSKAFEDCPRRYEYAQPLEATFWDWFKDNYLEVVEPKKLEELI